MNFAISSVAFNILVYSAIIIFLGSSAIVFSTREISILKKVLLLILIWTLPFLGGISAVLILLVPKNLLKKNQPHCGQFEDNMV